MAAKSEDRDPGQGARSSSDDGVLLKRVGQGDEAAFRRFYDGYADRVFRYAFTLLRNRHLAEEAAQETMVAVWNNASRYMARSKVSTWVFGIARNKAFDLIRREERGRRLPELRLTEPDPAPAVHRTERIMGALSGLPIDQREVVFLTFYEGLSYREIAKALGIPEGTVKSRMYHAKRKLAEALT